MRANIAPEIRKNIEKNYKTFSGTKSSVQYLCTADVKEEIDDEVNELQVRTQVNDRIDNKLKEIYEFNKNLTQFVKDFTLHRFRDIDF